MNRFVKASVSKCASVLLLVITLFAASVFTTSSSIASVASPKQKQPEVNPRPTSCILPNGTIIMSDVGYDAYYCLSIRNLNSVGAINGFPDGTFRPDVLVKRGEFSKMLYFAFGWQPYTPSSSPTFIDVPTSNVFYLFIETAAHLGVVTGAPCGSNTCFRPNDPIKRAELAKMVAISKGYNDDLSGIADKYGDSGDIPILKYYVEVLAYHAVAGPAIGACSSPPCFTPTAYSPRRDAALLLYIARFSPNLGQTFAQLNGTYIGVWVYMSTPDPSLVVNQWVAGPVVATDQYNGSYIESGPEKKCDPFCNIHPYGTSGDGGANLPVSLWETSINLHNGETFAYKSVQFGGGLWQSQFCSSGCQGMVTSNKLSNNAAGSLPYAIAGAETSNIDINYGFTTASNAQALNAGTSNFFFWCYDPSLPPWKTKRSTISGCNTANYSWTLNNN